MGCDQCRKARIASASSLSLEVFATSAGAFALEIQKTLSSPGMNFVLLSLTA
jgi:hypothetical protein